MDRRQLITLGLLAACAATAAGQYPYPYNYPRVRRGNAPKTTGVTGGHNDLAGSFHGVLKQLSNKEVTIQNDDDQTVVIRRSRKTKFLKDGKEVKPAEIALNSVVTVEASEDVDLKPTALSVSLDTAGKKDAPKVDIKQ